MGDRGLPARVGPPRARAGLERRAGDPHPAGLTETSRSAVREPGKSDPIDATAVARAALREGIDNASRRVPGRAGDRDPHADRLPRPARHRALRLANRLRWHLVAIAPELEAGLAPARLDSPHDPRQVARQLARLAAQPAGPGRESDPQTDRRDHPRGTRTPRRAESADQSALPRAARRARLRTDHRRDHDRPHRRRANGSPPTRCFARHAGTAPIPASSGNTKRHRLHRGGDRQLNRALHIIALSRARTDPTTRAYLDRKHAEGKTKLEAIRCLKRHLARHIWRLLYATQPPTPPTPIPPRPPSPRPISDIAGTAPILMSCIQ